MAGNDGKINEKIKNFGDLTAEACSSELTGNESLQLFDLLLVLAQECILGVLVDAWTILDALGAVCVAQRAQALLIVVVSRGEAGHHEGACVST